MSVFVALFSMIREGELALQTLPTHHLVRAVPRQFRDAERNFA